MISIIGTGRVGSAIAFLVASEGLGDLLLVNRHEEKAKGHALDISNSIPANSATSVIASDYSKIKNSEVIVITASTASYTNSRTDMFNEQKQMMSEIAKKIKENANPDAKILIVTNPVDSLTYYFQKHTSWPREQVMGIASSLDSSRFRYLISKELNIKQSEIKDALVIGEHGDTMVPLFSIVKYDGKPILDVLDENQVEKITKDLREYWKILREFKGPSVYGIAKNTFDVIKAIIQDNDISIPVSSVLNGEYGLSEVSLGIPVKINKKGIDKI